MTASRSPLSHRYQVGLLIISVLSTSTPYAGGLCLGALNDAGEDDIDAYNPGPSSRRNLTAYEAGDENRHHRSTFQKEVPQSQTNTFSVGPIPASSADVGFIQLAFSLEMPHFTGSKTEN